MKIVLFLAIALVFFCVCGKDKAADPSQTTQIMPLRLGNSWSYLSEQFDINGHVISSEAITWSVQSDTIIDSETWYRTIVLQNIDPYTTFFTNRSDGLWQKVSWEGDSDSHLAKYPALAGEAFSQTGMDSVTVELINKGVTVPAGSFICYKYHINQSQVNADYYSYFSPGVGLIMTEDYRDSSIFIRETLLSYRLE